MHRSSPELPDFPRRANDPRLTRRGLLQRAAGAGLAAAGAGALLNDSAGPSVTAAQGAGGTLVFDLGSEPENLDPAQQLAYTTGLLNDQMYDALIGFNPEDLSPEPRLAVSWESSPDGLNWTFTLREGVTFHDGTPFDANAVKFSFDRQLDPENPYYAMGQWSSASNLSFLTETRVHSPTVVTFVLSEPYNRFVERIGGFPIVSPAAVELHKEAFPENPVGAGPYRFVQWDKGQQVILARFDEYWGGPAGLDEIYFRAIPEEGARLAALLSGETSFALNITPESATRLQDSPGHTVVTAATGSLWFLAMNIESEPFKDVRMRQAVNHAIDKRAIVDDVLGGMVETAFGPLSPAYQDYDPKVAEYYPFDPEKARQLIAEAGWDTNREIVFRTSIGGSGMLAPEEMATVIQDNLRAVGLNTRIEVLEFISWMDAIRAPENELTVMSWNIAPIQPDQMFDGILSAAAFPPGFNTSYWTNEEFEQLMVTGRVEPDLETAREAYFRMQEIVMDEAPIVPVCHAQQIFGVANTVQGFAPSTSLEINLRPVTIAG